VGSYLDALELELQPRAASRRMGWLIAGGLLATMAGAAYQLSTGAPPDGNCRSAAGSWVELHWSPNKRAQLRDAFTRSSSATSSKKAASAGAEGEATAGARAMLAGRVESQLDRFTEQWSSVYGEACHDTLIDRTRTGATLERRIDCLEAQAFEFTEVYERVAGIHDDATWLERVDDLVRGLPRPALCLRTSQKVPEPEGAGPIRAEVAKARVQRRAAELVTARATLDEALERARALDSPATLVEALIERGYELDEAGEYEASATVFTEAVTRARGAELVRPEAH